MIEMMSLCQSRSMILAIPVGWSCGASARRRMITTSHFRDTVEQNASVVCKMQFLQGSEIEGPPAGRRPGDDDENFSSCDDWNALCGGGFGEGKRGADVSADTDIKARAA